MRRAAVAGRRGPPSSPLLARVVLPMWRFFMKPLQSVARLLVLLAIAGAAQAAQPPCSDEDFEKFSLYDAAAMNTRIPAQELRRIFSAQFGLEVGALNHLHARCNYALSARFSTQGSGTGSTASRSASSRRSAARTARRRTAQRRCVPRGRAERRPARRARRSTGALRARLEGSGRWAMVKSDPDGGGGPDFGCRGGARSGMASGPAVGMAAPLQFGRLR